MLPERSVRFRPLTRTDLGLLERWLAEPLVARWWNHEFTPEAVERDFGPAVDGDEPTELFVALSADGTAFGLIQRYRIRDYDEWVEELGPICDVPDGALGIDYFIGEADHRGRGLGAEMIAALVEDGWAATSGPAAGATCVIVPVSTANSASWRALERAGFTRIAEAEMEPDNPIDDRAHVVYRCDRP